MSRLIDADALKEYIDAQKGRPFIGCTIGEALKMMIDEQSTIEERKTGKWIPCSERLPEKKRKTYWVCTDTEYQCECRWTNNRFGLGESDNWGWSYFDTPKYTEIIAWMPLPEPYKGEQE